MEFDAFWKEMLGGSGVGVALSAYVASALAKESVPCKSTRARAGRPPELAVKELFGSSKPLIDLHGCLV